MSGAFAAGCLPLGWDAAGTQGHTGAQQDTVMLWSHADLSVGAAVAVTRSPPFRRVCSASRQISRRDDI